MSKTGTEILVNTQTLYDQTLAQSAKFNGGGFVTVWVDWASSVDTTVADGSWSAIKAQVFSAVGAKVGTEILVNTASLNWQQDPRVAVLRDGNFDQQSNRQYPDPWHCTDRKSHFRCSSFTDDHSAVYSISWAAYHAASNSNGFSLKPLGMDHICCAKRLPAAVSWWQGGHPILRPTDGKY